MSALPIALDEAAPRAARRAGRPPLMVADLFCGAGNSSNAARRAIAGQGGRMRLVAVNHWPVAIATHSANHPDAPHICQDIEVVKPRDAVPGGRLDLLLASPECVFHSRARGGRPINDQKRATAWCVQRWCSELYIRALVVENVPEFAEWGPLDGRGRPLPARKGETFRAWVAALEGMGYRVEWRVINSADHGDPTTRRRLYVQARRDGRRIRWPEATHAPEAGERLFGSRAKWRAARECIDWSHKGRSVFGRRLPLRPNTLRRLMAGVSRYFGPLAAVYLPALDAELGRSIARWGDTAKGGVPKQKAAAPGVVAPFLSILRSGSPPCGVDDPVPPILTSTHAALVEPFILVNRSNNLPRGAGEPVPAILSGGHLGVAEAFLVPQGANSPGRSVDAPVPALVTHGKPALVEPFLLGQHAGNAPRSVDEPVMALCAGGAVALVAPYYGGGSGLTCKPVDLPLDTVTSTARFGVAEPFIASYYGEGRGGTDRVAAADQPLRTITCENRHSLAEPFLVDVNHTGADWRVRSPERPMATLTGKRGTGLAEAFIIGAGGREAQSPPKSVEAPLNTMTGKGDKALAEPFLVRLDQTGGGGSHTRSVADPSPTVVTTQTIALAAPVIEVDGRRIVCDLLFRMLEPAELAKAMSFPEGYVFTGNKTEVTRQIGNAVSLRTMEALVACAIQDMAGVAP